MKIAGVREFREMVPNAVKGDEVVLITRRGKLAGILIPATNVKDLSKELRMELFEKLSKEIAKHLDERGITEEKLIRDFQAWRKARRTAGGGR
jgi:PHD/YefM family antitoxin component YafN of YafNO toxin-antitoxin module